MAPSVKGKVLDMYDTFTSTANFVFRLITLLFIVINFFIVNSLYQEGSQGTNMVLFISSSLILAALILFVEPLTYKKNLNINLAVNALIGLLCGLLMFSCQTQVSGAIFFTSVFMLGLRLPLKMAAILSSLYYIAYAAGVKGTQSILKVLLYNSHVLILFLSILYLCHYFSSIEKKKLKQDEAILDLADDKVKLTKSLGNKEMEINEAYWEMVETLIGVIEARDNFTGGHSVKVCEYSVLLARRLGWDEENIQKLMKAAILHDIGKMGIADSILLKPESLSKDEYSTIMNHPEIGCRILTRVKGLEDILPMILYHHERIDSTGYPSGLDGSRIPDGAKIIAIADAYDAMTSNRPYRKALLKKEAKKRLLEGSGTQFEARLVTEFIKIIDEDKVDDINNFRNMERIRKRTGNN